MNEDMWNAMSPEQQANHCWQELSAMIREALAAIRYTPGNDGTAVVSGLTTIVATHAT